MEREDKHRMVYDGTGGIAIGYDLCNPSHKAQELTIRVLDIVISLMTLALTSPLILMVMTLIKLEDPSGPLIYWSKRVGKGGRSIPFPKFRSMRIDAERQKSVLVALNDRRDGPFFKMKNDPRRTRVGTFIRKWSLDELPQLFSVLIGDMSLVGPRPVLEEELVRLPRRHQILLLTTTPGITGMAQVNGRAENSAEDEFTYQSLYEASRSVRSYLWIVFVLTPIAVLSRRGAH